MKKLTNKKLLIAGLILSGSVSSSLLHAQTQSSSDNVTVQPKADRIVPFKLSEKGIVRDVEWGGDLAWFSESNLRRCVAFMGKDNVEVVRTSYQPTYKLIDGDLQQGQKDTIQARISYLKWVKPDVKLLMNCDHPHTDPWYVDPVTGADPKRWVELMDVSMKYYQDAGYNVVSVAPFNEPDNLYSDQGTQNTAKRKQEFHDIVAEMNNNPRFDNIRICGANTLNTDVSLEWYNILKDGLDEGNTHQLAGSFDNYANFFTTVRNDGKHATNDEMHNVMEAMVGLEYGLQTGIWWGCAEYVRGEFCKASHGERLAYAEHRDNWTAASVYRAPDGKIQAFGGTSERQAVETSYKFISEERDVFFDGQGPQREYTMTLPGGTGYQQGQSNAEQVVNITWGEDIQPYVNGTYVILNKGTKAVMEIEGGSSNAGSNIQVGTYSFTKKYQQWNVVPVPSNVGGGFSYYTIRSAFNNMSLDLLNWSLDEEANIISYTPAYGENQQWYLEYYGDGWFYIRSRHSSLCLESVGANVQQQEIDGNDYQLWRFLPAVSRHSITTVKTPSEVTATAQSASIKIAWKNPGAMYTQSILRSETAGGPYELIARNISGSEFVDNKVVQGKTYYYTVKTVDRSLNSSQKSEEVSAAAKEEECIVARYDFNDNINDLTENLNTLASIAEPEFRNGHNDTEAVYMDGTNDFMQMSTDIASHKNITVAGWIYWNGGNDNQNIFSFSRNENSYFCLIPRSDDYKVKAVISYEGKTYSVEAPYNENILYAKWNHLAVTIEDGTMKLYVNGVLKDENTSLDTDLSEIRPFMNYIGKGVTESAPLFRGMMDDLHIYNYALNDEEINDIMNDEELSISSSAYDSNCISLDAVTENGYLNIDLSGIDEDKNVQIDVYNMQGICVKQMTQKCSGTMRINIGSLAEGIYMLQAKQGKNRAGKKIVIGK